MFWKLLLDASEAAGDAANNSARGGNSNYVWILLVFILILLVVYLFFSNRKSKQRQKEYTEQLAAIGPGNKVKTAGGICGVVVEVCDDNTVILETGSENSGKSYIKMDKELIAQTDAKGPTQIAREEAEEMKRAQKSKKKGEPEKGETGGEASSEALEAPSQKEPSQEGKQE